MAKSKSNKKVVVTKTSKATPTNSKTKKVQPTKSKGSKSQAVTSKEMIFGRENFKWIFIGLALITLGMLLMMGGSMPSPDVWDDSIIYSHRRITLAPLLILAGLGVEIYAIFK
jgi:hypothetical protein